MGEIKIHAGSFRSGSAKVFHQTMVVGTGEIGWAGEKTISVPLSDFVSVEIATEESVKRIGGTVGWGIAGGILLGPAGLLAGLILGGRGKEVTFVAATEDGRTLLATGKKEDFIIFKSGSMNRDRAKLESQKIEERRILKEEREAKRKADLEKFEASPAAPLLGYAIIIGVVSLGIYFIWSLIS